MSTSDADILRRVEGAAIDGRLTVLRYRQRQFRALHSSLVEHRDAALQAIEADDGCSRSEAQLVYGSALIELRNHYDKLDLKADLKQEYALARGESNVGRRTPIAITYIVPDTFTLFYSALSALFAALEAGSCVVIELKQTPYHSSTVLREVISSSYDAEALGVVIARAPADFLAKCVLVDQAGNIESNVAARRVLYSLSHRNVVIVDRTSDIQLAAKEIVASCSIFGGKSRYAPDLVLVNEYVASDLSAAMSRLIHESRTAGKAADTGALSNPKQQVRGKVDDILRSEIRNGKAKWVDGKQDSGMVEITDRQSQVASSKSMSSATILLCRFTSMDDVIDFLSSSAQQSSPVAALYIFGAQREGKYLSQYAPSQVTYVNHIPSQLAVGPMVPSDYAIDLRVRYAREMFELPSPQVAPGPRSHPVSSILKKAGYIDSLSRKPLKPTGQPPSGAWGFFEQGIVLGFVFYVLPITTLTLSGAGYIAWKGFQIVRA